MFASTTTTVAADFGLCTFVELGARPQGYSFVALCWSVLVNHGLVFSCPPLHSTSIFSLELSGGHDNIDPPLGCLIDPVFCRLDYHRRQEEHRHRRQDRRQQHNGVSVSPLRPRQPSEMDPDLDPSNMEWNLNRVHKVLGNLGRHATPRDIKTAYRLKSRRWHPGHHIGKPSFKEVEAHMKTSMPQMNACED
ncbi:hypothetical protein THAOC_01138 [Thalassiosira oceanica]|uniref:J domain-containing protein n=1 Tax=Thalassiosira oceanica TaxID=159749 RepID=K0TNE1_THAOC|nr:hypothetical protein THAOC_01138 [Thalassiosira oceanica]|eukprot:EJK77056.1 hypothetical protein THAOC_01138 [Thalassiosira oceanica]